jgi:uncharacterized surface protein with fasciclin (FAS1) repeats
MDMKITFRKIARGVAVIVLSLIMTHCKDEFVSPELPAEPPITVQAADNPDLDILVAALVKTNLAAVLSNPNSGRYTVFAPHDSAFVAFFRGVLSKPDDFNEDSVLRFIDTKLTATSTPINIAALASRLNYHIVSSGIPSSSITGNQVFTTLQGSRLSISKTGSAVLLNADILPNANYTLAGSGSKLRVPDAIVASNGYVHVVNKVMTAVTTASVISFLGMGVNYNTNPPTISGGTTSDGNVNNYNLLAAGLRKTNLAPVLLPNRSPLPDFTVFAPRDGAMITYINSLDNTVTNEAQALTFINNLAGTALENFTNLLKYHVINGRVLSTDLSDGQVVQTLLTGRTFTINVASSVTITDQNPASPNATVVTPNVLTNAGVLHALDLVLLPQ